MRITERLKAEHGVLLFQLDHLQGLVRRGAPRAVLQAVVETIATAERHHSSIEDQLLYPALVKVIGPESPLVQKSKAAHEELWQLVERIRLGAFDAAAIEAFVTGLREHLEREIHDVFALADAMVPAEMLEAMSNWDVEHIHEVNERRQCRAERWL